MIHQPIESFHFSDTTQDWIIRNLDHVGKCGGFVLGNDTWFEMPRSAIIEAEPAERGTKDFADAVSIALVRLYTKLQENLHKKANAHTH